MQPQPTKGYAHPGGHARDDLLRLAGEIRDADPLRMARLHPGGSPRYEDAALFRDVVEYLRPILPIVLQSKEVELSRRTIPTADSGEITLRFMLRPDGSVAKHDQANNADTASPLEFLRARGDLDAVLLRLSRALWEERTPIACAAADELHMVRAALGTAPPLRSE
jgi:hypothetical protein